MYPSRSKVSRQEKRITMPAIQYLPDGRSQASTLDEIDKMI